MVARTRPYDQFGPFILLKRLEADALGDLWRAVRVENGRTGPVVALRRLTGGSRDALASNARAVSQILPLINGASFVRDQQAGVVDGTPYITWEYGGGRSLRHIIDRARGGNGTQPNPVPLDQALVVAERVALSLATMGDLRDASGARLGHGALLPQFVWVSDDGEIRVGGQQFGSAIIASFSDAKVALDLGRYFSPDYRVSGIPQKNTDVYSMGAILFLLVTGEEPPDALTASAFGAAVRAAKTMSGEPIPADIRAILDKSLNIDASMRFDSMTEMKQALSALVSGGNYSATTFNLAFYLSTLLKKELEAEASEREVEAKVNVAAYAAAPAPVAAPVAASQPATAAHAPAPAASPLTTAAIAPKNRSKAPLFAVAAVVVAGLGAAGWMMFMKSEATPAATKVAAAQAVPVPKPAELPIIAEPISVTPTAMTTSTAPLATDTAAPAANDPEAQKKAFEEAVRRKLEAEMLKLQNDYLAELKRSQSRNAPVVAAPEPAAPVTASVAEERVPSAAQLDERRRQEAAATEESRTATAAAQTATSAPQVAQTQPAAAPAQQAVVPSTPARAVPTVREGDVVDVAALDVAPRRLQMSRPQYPPLALRQKIEATVFMTVLIDETGQVDDVRVLRGEPRFGLNDAAIRAIKSARFAPAMKDGKRVKTWMLQSIEFKQQ